MLAYRAALAAVSLSACLVTTLPGGGGGGAGATLVFTETVAESDIGRGRGILVSPGPPLALAALARDVLAGSYSFTATPPSTGTVEASGKAFAPITADFSTDTSLTLRIVAPAGQRFVVHDHSTLAFRIHFAGTGSAVDPLPGNALTFTLDGVPVSLDLVDTLGMDSDGESFLIGGTKVVIAPGTTFSEMAFTLDYSVDANGPVTISPGEDTLAASATSHIVFSRGASTTSLDTVLGPLVTVELVPEPASLALLAAGGMLALGRRRL